MRKSKSMRFDLVFNSGLFQINQTDVPFTHLSLTHGFFLEETDYMPFSNEMYLNCCTVFNMTSGFTNEKTS